MSLIEDCNDSGFCSGFVTGLVLWTLQTFWSPITSFVDQVGQATTAFADYGY